MSRALGAFSETAPMPRNRRVMISLPAKRT